MAQRIATLSVDPLAERAQWAASTTRWLIVLIIVFGALLRATDSMYFLFVTGGTVFTTALVALAAIAANASVNERLLESLEKRGLSQIHFIRKGYFFAFHDGQKIKGTLTPEGRKQLAAWVEPI